jgi:hypothetical protein
MGTLRACPTPKYLALPRLLQVCFGLAQTAASYRFPENTFQYVDVGKEGPTHSIGFDSMGNVYLEQDSGILRGAPTSKGTYLFQTIVSGAVSGLFVNRERDPLSAWMTSSGAWRETAHGSSPASYSLPLDQWGSVAEDNLGNLWVRSRTRLFELPHGQRHTSLTDQMAFLTRPRRTSMRIATETSWSRRVPGSSFSPATDALRLMRAMAFPPTLPDPC